MANYIEYFGLPGSGKSTDIKNCDETIIEVVSVRFLNKIGNVIFALDMTSIRVLAVCLNHRIRLRGLVLFLERYGRYKQILRLEKPSIVDEGILQALWAMSPDGGEILDNAIIRKFLTKILANAQVKVITVSFNTWMNRRYGRDKLDFLCFYSDKKLMKIHSRFISITESLSGPNIVLIHEQ